MGTDPTDLNAIKEDFLEWSGGTPPESDYQITVYIDYTAPIGSDPDAVRKMLREFMQKGE